MDKYPTFIERLNHAVEMRSRELGESIRRIDLAAAAEVSPSAVTLWYKAAEEGRTTELRAASILGLARYLKVRVEWLRDNQGPMRVNGQIERAEDPRLDDDRHGISDEARELIDMITAADRSHAVSKETLHAVTHIFGQMTGNQRGAVDLAAARLRQRAERLVERHQPKAKKGKGAA